MAELQAGSRPLSTVRVALASRGDELTQPLQRALQLRYAPVRRIDVEMGPFQRLATAALTWRPTRAQWIERFHKSGVAFDLRSRRCAHELIRMPESVDLVIQVHALFQVTGRPYVTYVDCTHSQAARMWPAWNPLRGWALRRWYEREQAVYAGAEHIFTLASQTRDSLVEDYGVAPEMVTVVGAGNNFPVLPELTLADQPVDRPPTILFVGNDFIRKGGEVLLAAFARVRDQVPDARLQIVGARYPVAPQPGVYVLGRVRDRDRLATLYREADVFALPSFFEPFGLVLLEAMAYGLPCVGTWTCGTTDIVDDGVTGLLVEAGDEIALAAALIQLLRSPGDATAMGLAGRRHLEAGFQWTQVVQRMEGVISQCVAREPRTPV